MSEISLTINYFPKMLKIQNLQALIAQTRIDFNEKITLKVLKCSENASAKNRHKN